MSFEDVKTELKQFGLTELTLKLCFDIVDFIRALPPSQAEMLTFRTLTNAVGKEAVDSELLTAITILVSSSVAALDSKALFIDDDYNEYELSLDDLSEARESGELVHPQTGQLVPDFETKVIPFFVPSERLR